MIAGLSERPYVKMRQKESFARGMRQVAKKVEKKERSKLISSKPEYESDRFL